MLIRIDTLRWKNWSKIGQSGNLRKKLFGYRGQKFNGAKPGKPKSHLRKNKKTVVAARVSKGKNSRREDREVTGSQTAETLRGAVKNLAFTLREIRSCIGCFWGETCFTVWVLY